MIDLSSIFPKVLEEHANGSVLEIIFRNMTVFISMVAAVLFRKWGILKFKNISLVSTAYSIVISGAITFLAIIYFCNREKADGEVIGSYLCFTMAGGKRFAVVPVTNPEWWIMGLIVLAGVGLVRGCIVAQGRSDAVDPQERKTKNEILCDGLQHLK